MPRLFEDCAHVLVLAVLFIFAICLVLLVTPRRPAEYYDEKAAAHCSPVCHVNHAVAHCVPRCPGRSCLCVKGVGGVWYFNETIGGGDE